MPVPFGDLCSGAASDGFHFFQCDLVGIVVDTHLRWCTVLQMGFFDAAFGVKGGQQAGDAQITLAWDFGEEDGEV